MATSFQDNLSALKNAPKEKKRGLLHSLAWFLLIFIVIRGFFLENFYIPSSSMVPGLLFRDFLLVKKWSYGYSRHSFLGGSILPYFSGRIFATSTPKRGDVAVFSYPLSPSTTYIKRVVGLPGDKVQMVGGILHINGSPCELEPMGPANFSASDTGPTSGDIQGNLYKETFPDGHAHIILKQQTFGEAEKDTTEVFEVPKKHYFMVGDNRDASLDSRYTEALGFVHEDYFVGKAFCKYMSVEYPADLSWWQVWRWLPSLPLHVRYGRLFTAIE